MNLRRNLNRQIASKNETNLDLKRLSQWVVLDVRRKREPSPLDRTLKKKKQKRSKKETKRRPWSETKIPAHSGAFWVGVATPASVNKTHGPPPPHPPTGRALLMLSTGQSGVDRATFSPLSLFTFFFWGGGLSFLPRFHSFFLSFFHFWKCWVPPIPPDSGRRNFGDDDGKKILFWGAGVGAKIL